MKTVLFVETNSAGNGTLGMLAAQKAGYRTHFFARNPAEYERHAPNPLYVADEFSHVDTYDVTKMLRVVDGRDDYAAVLAYDELRVVQAALLGEYLGTPHNPPVEAMLRVRFKDLMRCALAGTRWSVRHSKLSLTDGPATKLPMPFPFVVKPVDEAASVGVRICRDRSDFVAALSDLRQITACANSRGYQRLDEALAEELIEGDEYSAEFVWSAGRADWELIGFTAKMISSEPSCVEVGYVFPHRFGGDADDYVAAELRACLNHLGLRETMAHVEFRRVGERVRLLEINPRPAGGAISQLVSIITGVGLADLHLAAHLGNSDKLLAGITMDGYAGAAFVVPEQAGKVVRLEPPLRDIEGIMAFRESKLPRVVEAGKSNEDRLGHVVFRAKCREEVERKMRRACRDIKPLYGDADHEARPASRSEA